MSVGPPSVQPRFIFARHGKRTQINIDDVRLLLRRKIDLVCSFQPHLDTSQPRLAQSDHIQQLHDTQQSSRKARKPAAKKGTAKED